MPFDQLAPRRPGGIVRTFRYVRYTGHPPPLQQIANQVRTTTGYTLARATPDGARHYPSMSPGQRTGAGHQAAAEREEDAREAEQERQARDCADVLAWLKLAERDLPRPIIGNRSLRHLPALSVVAQQISVTWSMARLFGALRRLEMVEALRLVSEAKGRRGAAIRLAGSSLTLITTGFPEDVTFT